MVGLILTVANLLSIVVMLVVGIGSDRRMRRAGFAAVGFVIEGVGVRLMPTRSVETSSGVFSSLTNVVGAGAPALMGAILAATGSYTGGFSLLVGTVVVSIVCCAILIPQGY